MNINNAAVYNLVKPSKLIAELPYLFAFNIVLAACSYISITLPFSPVPITGQTFGVLLVAMTLGRVRGTAVVAAYLLEGAAGLPVFAGGTAGLVKFFGPTGGYLFGFLAAAYIVGSLADRGWDKNYIKSIIAMSLGTVVIFIMGLLWLNAFVPDGSLFAMGLFPFIPGAVLKIGLAFSILPSIWKFVKPDINND